MASMTSRILFRNPANLLKCSSPWLQSQRTAPFSVGTKSCDKIDDELKKIEPKVLDVKEFLDPTKHDKKITITGQEDVSIVSGVPEEHIKPRLVRIYKPSKNAMQSGTHNTHYWEMEFETRERWENPLMGWTSSADPLSNMKVTFDNENEAIAFCEKNGWQWYVDYPKEVAPKVKSYGFNFSWNKRTRVSTK